MSHNYNLQTSFSIRSRFSDQNKTQTNSLDSISPINQTPHQFFMQLEADCQQKIQLKSNETLLKSNISSEINYSNTDIQEDNTQETVYPINTLNTKSFSQFAENEDKDIKLDINFLNTSIPQQKQNQDQSFCLNQQQNRQSNDYFEETSQIQSNTFLNDTEFEFESLKNSSYQNTEKTEVSSIKSTSQKRVTFNEKIEQKVFQKDDINALEQKIQILLRKYDVENRQLESNYFFGQSHGKQTRKTILKASKSWEQTSEYNQSDQQQQYDSFERTQFDMDFCEIINEEIIQQLLQSDSPNKNQNYFFSELVTKISRSGEKKKRIIFFNQNSFYVLKNLSSHKGIQKFNHSEINKIVVHSNNTNFCSIVVRSKFQLTLKINHFNEFIKTIGDIFKYILKTNLPITYKYNKSSCEKSEDNIIENSYASQSDQLSMNYQRQFYITINKINNNKYLDDLQILGLLQIFDIDICISSLEKCEGLNRLLQVDLIEIDLQNRRFFFKSIQNQNNLFLIMLQNDLELTIFIDQIQKFYKKKTQTI
ncbi:hypothetical protein TTHERM_00745760 (macronuclear) [Tetrahymena thermophila SB210]|uniref:TH1 domain-containing protein n=1 Tax=Tetrahymena thermophila (strain SB210) TaxID=312017 RepID=Q239V4_TETTS|nr:hypothetical protein TTHERM_00745760 [Tetrahymena thermophila SB210]EAR93304.2 hypothetical protein TTHERM_00745760 [Tetrahymena thermophila SB210]|eukprot:XP_001013549.2 hypothetical protein TTHERM_00745760 [Tetrahymena thermophila SB210]